MSHKIRKIYYINLDRRQDRKTHFLQQCRQAGIDMRLVQRFSAIDGNNHIFSEEELQLFQNCDVLTHPKKNNLMGNQLSHYRILEDIVRNQYEYAIVFQDDVVISKDFVEKVSILVDKHVPDDAIMVNMGLFRVAAPWQYDPYDVNDHKTRYAPCKEIVNDMVCRLEDPENPCSLAYIISKEGAENLLNYFRKTGFLRATDGNYNDLFIKHNIHYASREVLCTGAPMGTDVFQ